MPLLARMLLSPLFIDIRAGAVSGLGDLLSDRRISSDGHVAVAVGPGQGERLMEAIQPALSNADVFTVRGGSLEAAGELQAELRGKNYDALVGIGGGRTLDVAKYAATRLALPMVAVATNLAHDGIASPVSSLLHEGGKGSFGVGLPMAVVVDLDYVRASPARMVRSGIGDVVSNLSAIADWHLAGRERQEPVDGLAVTFARTAAAGGGSPHRRHRVGRLPHRARGGAGALRHGDGRRRAPAGRAAAATTRSCTRSTRCSPAPATTASSPVSVPSTPSSSRRRRVGRAGRRVPAAARAAARAGRPRALGRAVRRGGRAGPEHPAGPLHHPRAPRPRPGRRPGPGGRLRRVVRRVTDPPAGSQPGGSVPQSVSAQTGRSVVAGQVVTARIGTLWDNRRILSLLVTRDLKVKYADSVLGYLWSILEPLAMAGVYWFVFTKLMTRQVGEDPYIVFLLCGMLPWQWASAVAALVDEGAVQGLQAGPVDEPAPRDLGPAHRRVEVRRVPVYALPVLAFFALLTRAHAAPGRWCSSRSRCCCRPCCSSAAGCMLAPAGGAVRRRRAADAHRAAAALLLLADHLRPATT